MGIYPDLHAVSGYLSCILRQVRRLRAEQRAVSAVEFALVAPLLAVMGLGAIELANMAICYMRVSQVAISVADNASRAKQSTAATGAVMREYDVGEAFAQVDQVYPGLRFFTRGRVILSSLEQNLDKGQWIHWQRCRGSNAGASKYGTEGTGKYGTAFLGMGPTDNRVTADSQSAIMFVEVYYNYEPLFFTLGNATPTIYRSAAMYVRDDRDLTGGAGANNAGIANPSPQATVYSC